MQLPWQCCFFNGLSNKCTLLLAPDSVFVNGECEWVREFSIIPDFRSLLTTDHSPLTIF